MSDFQVGDKVRHCWTHSLYEISKNDGYHLVFKNYEHVGKFPKEAFYKPQVEANTKLFCKNLQVNCESLDYSYRKKEGGPEFIEVRYPDGSSCEASVDSFELRKSKFKIGDNVQFISVYAFDDNYDRIVTGIKYNSRYNKMEIYYDVMYKGSLVEKTYDYEYRLMLKSFKPTIKKGDIILYKNTGSAPIIAHNDSFMADGQEWVSYGYKDVLVSLVNKYVLATN